MKSEAFLAADASYKRLCDRYEFKKNGQICYCQELCIPVDVVEISRTGLKIACDTNVPAGVILIKVEFEENQWLEVECEKVWQNKGYVGFRLYSPNPEWSSFIDKNAPHLVKCE